MSNALEEAKKAFAYITDLDEREDQICRAVAAVNNPTRGRIEIPYYVGGSAHGLGLFPRDRGFEEHFQSLLTHHGGDMYVCRFWTISNSRFGNVNVAVWVISSVKSYGDLLQVYAAHLGIWAEETIETLDSISTLSAIATAR